MRFYRLTNYNALLDSLKTFAVCFPRLLDRVSSVEDYSKKLIKHGKVYVMNEGEKPYGFVAFYDNNTTELVGYIALIGILPAYRRLGIGTKLINETIDIMRNSGMKYVLLEVDDDNATAIKYYQSNGFSFSGKAREESLYMKRKI